MPNLATTSASRGEGLDSPGGKLQTPLALTLIAVFLATNCAVAALARYQPLLDWMFARQMNAWRRTNVIYAHNVGFSDADDRLLVREIPETDYHRGGVFFLGSSTTQHSIAPWLLPPDERQFVHNFAIKSANMKEQFQFVRYLVEKKGLLEAGQGKTMVVVGLAHFDTRSKLVGTTDWNYVPALFQRHGLYGYDPQAGISDSSDSRVLQFIRRERMRSYGFLKTLFSHADFAGPPFGARRHSDESDRAAREHVHKMMGYGDWLRSMVEQLSQLDQMFKYLHDHGAALSAVLLPLASWNRGLPEADEFQRRAVEICRAHDIPLLDLTWSLPDDSFADHSHLNFRGQEALTKPLGGLARSHLMEVGLIPSR